ncbi:hypothetical protein DDE18_01525 [Nocardioides gansuensis]|uniref:Ornithine cyclodeaminase n=1 Tax=Nocardioides gansuensis TaxID=2138300 RepID=A0A2T8FF32_9ACTN|nr:ornithine cyclodeaminase family protein [Nocardioides gansuensis]PVG84331.1 hypothetical protein DDE18_01525 [Nocardioides gansuensis]
MTSLSWLDRDQVRELMPSVEEQLDLVHETYVASARGRVELPPKPGLHPREGAFLNAMPAWLMDRDVVAMKWVSAFPANASRGLPTISGLIIVNDPETGLPALVMDAEEITAIRTAVASGVAVRHLAHPGWQRVAILGYGAQGRSHAAVMRVLHPDVEVVAWGPRLTAPGHGIEVAPDARSAVEGADVVITSGPMRGEPAPVVDPAWLSPRCLVLPVDYDAQVRPEVSMAADLFAVDDVPQFESFVERGSFAGWAAPHGTLGEALLTEPSGVLRLVCSLGVGSIDAVIAGEVWEREKVARIGLPLRS